IATKHHLKDKKMKNLPSDSDKIRSKKLHYLKTHYLWYPELSRLI
ncbi:unnamed protein product, partial [marine sediment metagenome]